MGNNSRTSINGVFHHNGKIFSGSRMLILGFLALTLLFTSYGPVFSLQKAIGIREPESFETSPQLNDCLSRVDSVRGIGLYSQNDEDGALLQTLRCMGGHGKKEYFEFGSETGVEVNTRILRDLYDWHGHLLDGSNEDSSISLHQEFFTPSNIVSLLEKYNASKTLDVLSVDTDYDDFFITREILLAGYKPRVLINEYNSNFGSEWSVSTMAKPVGKEKDTYWQRDYYFGASAPALIMLAQAFGYTPVFSNKVNLFFVRLDQAKSLNMLIPSVDNFPRIYPTSLHEDCSGKKFNLIESSSMAKAIDPTISHVDFASSLPTISFTAKDYVNGDGSEKWRIFKEESTTRSH